MADIAILGATGPTSIHLANILLAQNKSVRVVSRSRANLRRVYGHLAVERVAADVLDLGEAIRAVAGCRLVFDCLGLPAHLMHQHPAAARGIAKAIRSTGARCVQVSSYWAYLPLAHSPLNEEHPRVGGSHWMRWRREAEDILREAGAAILHLPDFYGSHVHTSTLQNALTDATAGRTMTWVGSATTPREYVLVSDAMEIAVRVAAHDEAFGKDWIVPGSGRLTGARVAEIATRHLGQPVRLRTAGMATLRLVSLFNRELRGFMQVAPEYMKPIAYDARRLEALIGKPEMTSYEAGIARTLDALSGSKEAR